MPLQNHLRGNGGGGTGTETFRFSPKKKLFSVLRPVYVRSLGKVVALPDVCCCSAMFSLLGARASTAFGGRFGCEHFGKYVRAIICRIARLL